jgi:hypothetical protein
MKLLRNSFIAFAILVFTGCKKELSLENQTTPPPPPTIPEWHPDLNNESDVLQVLTSGKFQLRAFYSDIPIDYVENDDQIKNETNLWPYVSEYLKDDVNIFHNDSTNVDIEQHQIKMEGVDDAVLHKKYKVGKDNAGIYMKFLDNKYNPLKYRLTEIGKDYFVVGIGWKNGSTLYSRFQKL